MLGESEPDSESVSVLGSVLGSRVGSTLTSGVGSTTTHSSKAGSRSDPTSPLDVSADTVETGDSNKAHDNATTNPPRPERSMERQ